MMEMGLLSWVVVVRVLFAVERMRAMFLLFSGCLFLRMILRKECMQIDGAKKNLGSESKLITILLVLSLFLFIP